MTDTITLPRSQFLSASANPFVQLFKTEESTTTNRGGREIELALEWKKIQRIFDELVTDLERYEAQFGIDSEQFYNDFQSGNINDEREEYYDWRVKYSAYQSMNSRFELTR